MKYKSLSTTNPEVAELQSQYRSTWHVVHFIVSILLFPWVIIWVIQGISNAVHNKQVDNEIEEIVKGG